MGVESLPCCFVARSDAARRRATFFFPSKNEVPCRRRVVGRSGAGSFVCAGEWRIPALECSSRQYAIFSLRVSHHLVVPKANLFLVILTLVFSP